MLRYLSNKTHRGLILGRNSYYIQMGYFYTYFCPDRSLLKFFRLLILLDQTHEVVVVQSSKNNQIWRKCNNIFVPTLIIQFHGFAVRIFSKIPSFLGCLECAKQTRTFSYSKIYWVCIDVLDIFTIIWTHIVFRIYYKSFSDFIFKACESNIKAPDWSGSIFEKTHIVLKQHVLC